MVKFLTVNVPYGYELVILFILAAIAEIAKEVRARN